MESSEGKGPHPEHSEVPLSQEERRRITDEITASRLRHSSVRNIGRLVRIVEMALDPSTGSIRECETPDNSEERQAQARITKEIQKIEIAAKKLNTLITPYGSPPPHSLLSWVNPFSLTIFSLFPQRRQREQADIANVLHRLSALLDVSRLSGKSGRPPVLEASRQLVRAVCFFMSSEGLSIQYTWPPEEERTGDGKRGGTRTALTHEELPPRTPTTALIVATAQAFRMSVSNSRLKTHLTNLGREVKRGAGKPTEFCLGWLDLSADEREALKSEVTHKNSAT